jgi:hypothetical protein
MLNYSGYPTFDKIKCYGIIDFNTEDHKLLEYIAAIFETFSINYDNVDSLMEMRCAINVMVHVVIIISQILMI